MQPIRSSLPNLESPTDEVLQSLAAALSPETGDDFFRSLAAYLSTTCGVDYALVGKPVDGAPERVETVAFACRGLPIDNIVYDLCGSPCERVVDQEARYYETGAAAMFPEDRMLAEKGIDSYLGVPLYGRDRRSLGIIALMHTAPIPDPSRTRAILQLVADRTAAEFERLRLEEQVRYAQKLESLGVLAGGVAHDFNNMLTTILGYSSLLASEIPQHTSARSMLGEIDATARRAAELTRQMLTYAGRGRLVVQPVCLASLVQGLAKLLHAAVSKKVEFRFELEPVGIQADAALVRQIVVNLITNASEAAGEDAGVVVVRSGCRTLTEAELQSDFMRDYLPAGDYAFLEIEDDGCGMDARTLERIFDPFFTTKFTGRGLGLAAVLGIVRGHHGLVQVESEPGRGTRVAVLLPAFGVPNGAADEGAVAATPPSEGSVFGTVLVVDDEKSVRRVTRDILERANYHVLEASDGPTALELLATETRAVSAVLLDLTMPLMNGWEVAQRLREVAPRVPVVLMSGYSDPRPKAVAGVESKMPFVQKPFLTEELLGRLRRAIASSSRA